MNNEGATTVNPRNTMKIICLGKTGTGKSSLANTLLGKIEFEVKRSTRAVTTECSKGHRVFEGIELIVVDTPGLFSADRSPDEIAATIAASTQAVLPGPHAFLLVFSCDRFTAESQEVVNWMTNRFGKDQYGKNALDYSVVVFTHVDSLDENQTLESFLPESRDDPLRRIMSACGNRYYGLNNREREQSIKTRYVTELVKIINLLIEKNQGHEYAPPLMSDIAQVVQRRFKQSAGQFKFVEPNGTIKPHPEAIEAVKEFYRLQQQRNQQGSSGQRQHQQTQQETRQNQQEDQQETRQNQQETRQNQQDDQQETRQNQQEEQ